MYNLNLIKKTINSSLASCIYIRLFFKCIGSHFLVGKKHFKKLKNRLKYNMYVGKNCL